MIYNLILPNSGSKPKIYGATWDGSESTVWTRTDDAKGFSAPVPYHAGATAYSSPFDSCMPWSGMTAEERTGGTMVKIPKFWYQLENNSTGGLSIRIADKKPADGTWYVSPAHKNRGDGSGERDVVYIGKYHCASDYKSQASKSQEAYVTHSAARSGCRSVGEGYQMMDFNMLFTIWLLYLVEFADWNSQAKIGGGCSEGGFDEGQKDNGITDTVPYHTGTTAPSIGATVYGFTKYRNIESLWDNVLDWIDGCYYNRYGMYVEDNPSEWQDTAGGKNIGNPAAGYPSKFTVTNVTGTPLFYPSAASGNESTYSCDTWSAMDTNPCYAHGGYYSKSSVYGLFHLQGLGETKKGANIGTRLMELP